MKNKKIYINGRFLTQALTGIPRFSYEICVYLQRLGVEFVVIAPRKIRSEYKITFPLIQTGKLNSHFWEQIDLLNYLRKEGNPLLLSFSGLGPVSYKNHICTIHDIAFLRDPKWFPRSYTFVYKHLTPIVARSSIKILTVSDFSRQEIQELLHINSQKIEVIYNAVSENFLNDSEIPYNLEAPTRPYILTVSSHNNARKNFLRIVEAFRLLLKKRTDIDLYIVGDAAKVLDSENVFYGMQDNIKILGRLSDEALKAYYRKAEMFVHPSLYEGFGIPPLEAMAMGCPVIASDIPAIREVCGDAFLRCDPTAASSIAQAIEHLLNTPGLRSDLIQKGNIQYKLYSWEKSAIKLKALLNKLS